ncbi:MAG: hydroxyacid dehydrogenase, partial [Eubacteriales bacterium]|nr:hydroxyacid dehydrogenase [Eubacteriales bacterium]
RGMDAAETQQTHREIAQNLLAAARATGKGFLIVSRSDSTLRGHYPLETETLRETLETQGGMRVDGEILMPFFAQGGRYTIGNVHYVATGDRLIPAGDTEFAKDRTFGYSASDLRYWIAEKTGGVYPPQSVTTVSLAELRGGGLSAVTEKLNRVEGFGKVVVNAVEDADAERFVTALAPLLARGKRFLYRSAAALARALGGVEERPLLTRAELVNTVNRNGGLIVVGSHVQKTTRQLEALRRDESIAFLELNQHLALDEQAFAAECARARSLMNEHIKAGRTVAVYTRRDRFDLNTGTKEDELRLAVRISDAITALVASLSVRPNFIIAKGGITSSDIGVKALRVRRAKVMGQILPGIPVWLTGAESLFPDLPYVIFPGNVGEDNSLYDAVQKMKA